jgi:hypothetical protein
VDGSSVTVDSVALRPAIVRDLPTHSCESLLFLCRIATAALEAELDQRVPFPVRRASARELEDERVLTREEAAQRMSVTEGWLKHHGTKLPFYVKNGKFGGYLLSGLTEYLRNRAGRK